MLRLLVCSFGGVGSKCLIKGLLQTQDRALLNQAHAHFRTPPDKRALDGRTMIYMFGDPFNAVISFFNRRTKKTRSHGFDGREGAGNPEWVVNHCRNIGGDHDTMRPEWDLRAYLENGADLLKLEEHFDNWVNARTEFPLLFVRYETMWDRLPEIFRFVGSPDSAVSRFPPREPRGSSWEDEPERTKAMLANMYGALRARIMAAPDIWLGGNKPLPRRI